VGRTSGPPIGWGRFMRTDLALRKTTPSRAFGTRWQAAAQLCAAETVIFRRRRRGATRTIPAFERRAAKRAEWTCLVAAVMLIISLPQMAAADDQRGGVGGPFALTDQNGRPVTDADFHGRFMLIYFGYTSCPDVCPTALYEIGQAIEQLTPAERANVAPIFITVDPDHDAPKVLADYVSSFSSYLVGLTGPSNSIREVEREFHVYAYKHYEADGSYAVDHKLGHLSDGSVRPIARHTDLGFHRCADRRRPAETLLTRRKAASS
jgi:cytochrome oxidase Cu insertion factor (SCO1/SenC/PrrC family)